jgi:Lon protease-like protein
MNTTPLFPLPDCVLFPGAVLPLHIFEDRYRSMIRAIASGQEPRRNVAIALLQDGYEELYQSDRAPIHEVVCIGRMIQCEPLPDGRYNIMLLGTTRARIMQEHKDRPYRRAELRAIPTMQDITDLRAAELIATLRPLVLEVGVEPCSDPEVFEQLVEKANGIEGVIDLLSHYAIGREHSTLKQRLLEEPTVSIRSEILLRFLRDTIAARKRSPDVADEWPPSVNLN